MCARNTLAVTITICIVETCNLDYCLECGEARRRWATASGGQIPQLDDLQRAANSLQVTAGRLVDDLFALQMNSPGIRPIMLRTAMMFCESDPQGLAETETALDSLRTPVQFIFCLLWLLYVEYDVSMLQLSSVI